MASVSGPMDESKKKWELSAESLKKRQREGQSPILSRMSRRARRESPKPRKGADQRS